MKNLWKWIAVTLAVVLVGSWVVTPLLHSFGIATSYMPMMGGFGGGREFGGRMGFPGTGGMLFAGLGAFGGALLPLVLLGLAVWGGISLIKSATAKPSPAVGQPQPDISGESCPHCGKIVQDDWSTCPFCGEKI